MSRIDIDLDDEETLRLWMALGDLAERLPGEWTLIGGLMVQLHAVEHGMTDVRATIDIDILGQARPQGALSAIDTALQREGFEPIGPDLDGYAHRYRRCPRTSAPERTQHARRRRPAAGDTGLPPAHQRLIERSPRSEPCRTPKRGTQESNLALRSWRLAWIRVVGRRGGRS
jgi:hypothetical protein